MPGKPESLSERSLCKVGIDARALIEPERLKRPIARLSHGERPDQGRRAFGLDAEARERQQQRGVAFPDRNDLRERHPELAFDNPALAWLQPVDALRRRALGGPRKVFLA